MGLVICEQQNYYFDTQVEEKTLDKGYQCTECTAECEIKQLEKLFVKGKKKVKMHICLITFCEKKLSVIGTGDWEWE